MKLEKKLNGLDQKSKKLRRIKMTFNFNSINLKLSLFLSLFLFTFNLGFSVDPIISIDENLVINYLDTSSSRASIETSGILTLYNPSLTDTIYEFSIPLSLDALIGFNKIDIDNSSNKFSFGFNKIKGQIIKPNETVKVGYTIYGIVNYDIKNLTVDKNLSILEYYSEGFDLLSNVIVNVQKANREGGRGDISGNYTYESGSETQSDRLVSTTIKNPTNYNYNLEELKVYRTQSSQPYFTENDLVKTYKNLTLTPYYEKSLDFMDLDSTDFSVYWVSQNIFINYFINKNISFKINEYSPDSGGSGGSSSSGSGKFFKPNSTQIIVKKTTDKTLISSGEEFTVTLRVVNIGRNKINNLELFDIVPSDHDIKDVTKGVKIENGSNLRFEIENINGYDEFVVSYTLINSESIKGITYLKPASVEYNSKTYFSDGVLIVNDLLPDKKVFVQKKVDIFDEDFARITITVKNLGSNLLEDLLITDILDNNAIIKDISQVFDERGVWNIKTLKPGEDWEVSYLIERNSKIEILPNIFGVDSDDVFGTLVFTEEVVTIFEEQPKTVEKIGMIVAVGLLIFYLLF